MMKRFMARSLVTSALLVAADVATGQASPSPTAGPVRTTSGLVQGVATASAITFKGIPYAAAPVGALRWRSPRQAAAWSDIRRADSFGAPCAQAPLRGMTQLSDQSREDCLYLNVWTPRSGGRARRPVMVWIHGGGFVNGSGTSATYDGEQFAARGVILITINYRLGVFGFLAHPALTGESKHRSSGNFGLDDQIAALRWVRDNAAAFGGDPKNVTLFGQSAGGASVLDLLSSPLTNGLFSKVIIQSGVAPGAIAPTTLAEAEKHGAIFAGRMQPAVLRGLDTAQVLRMAGDAGRKGVRFAPVLDGYLLNSDPLHALSAQSRRPLPLLVGSNAREGLGTPESDQFQPEVRRTFGINAVEALRFYGRSGDAPDPLLGTPAQQFATDSTFRCGNVRAALLNAARGAPTWQYQFEQFVPGREQFGAGHSFEVPYVFGNLSSTGYSAANYGPSDRRLSALMTNYWTNFAKTGNPNGPGLPTWPQYTPRRKAYVRLSSALPNDVEAASDLRGELCSMLPTNPSVQR